MSDVRMWIFGYASLLWHPGFPVAERRLARLEGWHRSFCMWSVHHRGTPESPGLVLALDAQDGGVCLGVALGVAPGHEEPTLGYLRERELISSAYIERHLPVAFADGVRAEALAYVVDPAHPQYTGPLTLDAQAEVIARAQGGRGPNAEYLWNTVAHLADLGIADPDLDWLAARVRELAAA
jgi:glutathione-specific gamma-glutamylcyclotransferase